MSASVMTKPQSNMELYAITKNTISDLECSICCKAIQKTFFQCGAPCNKIFHVSCMEQMIERTIDAAWEEDKEPEHKCCYCRREIDINQYMLQLTVRQLTTLKAGGCYYVGAALTQLKYQMANGDADEDIEYEIFEIRPNYYEKKPKQAKKTAYAKKTATTKQPRMRVKQNIGGRRR